MVPAIVGATNFTVGDDEGWALGVNYTKWVQGKEFKVGDKIVFKYNHLKHNVLKVGGDAFKSCNKTTTAENAPLATGNDEITLATAGRKWYICAVGDHCEKGMKLFINVEEAEAPAPSPTGGEGNSAGAVGSFARVCLAGAAAVAAMAMLF